MLQSFQEANNELENITLNFQGHPDVLEVRWQLYANLGNWHHVLDTASKIARLRPDRVEGFLYMASSLHELGRCPEARDVLLDAAKKFPEDEIVAYDLGCVLCLMQNFDEAEIVLARAVELAGNQIKVRALDDPDLEPIWSSLKKQTALPTPAAASTKAFV